MRPRKTYKKPGSESTLEAIAGGAGLEREEFFANGGTALAWKGGPSHTFRDRKAEAKRRACRGKREFD